MSTKLKLFVVPFLAFSILLPMSVSAASTSNVDFSKKEISKVLENRAIELKQRNVNKTLDPKDEALVLIDYMDKSHQKKMKDFRFTFENKKYGMTVKKL